MYILKESSSNPAASIIPACASNSLLPSVTFSSKVQAGDSLIWCQSGVITGRAFGRTWEIIYACAEYPRRPGNALRCSARWRDGSDEPESACWQGVVLQHKQGALGELPGACLTFKTKAIKPAFVLLFPEPIPALSSWQRDGLDSDEARLSPQAGRLIRQLLDEDSDPMLSPRFYAYGQSQQYLDDTEVPPSPPNSHSFMRWVVICLCCHPAVKGLHSCIKGHLFGSYILASWVVLGFCSCWQEDDNSVKVFGNWFLGLWIIICGVAVAQRGCPQHLLLSVITE